MKSIKTKIIAGIGSLVILSMILTGTFVVNKNADALITCANYLAKASTENISKDVSSYFIDYISMIKQASRDQNIVNILSSDSSRSNFQKSPYYGGTLKMLADSTAADSENILSFFIASANTDMAFDGGGWIADPGFDVKTRGYWFKNNADIEKGYLISEPYQDVDTGSMVITIAAPVYSKDGSKINGVVAIDIQITVVNKMVTEAKSTYETAYQILVSSQNVVLAHKDETKVLLPIEEIGFSQNMVDDVITPVDEVIKFDDSGIPSFGMVSNEKYSGFKIVSVVPKAEYVKTINDTRNISIMLFSIALLVVFGILYVISNNIVRPIKRLQDITDELASGNLNVDIDVHSNDEIGHLAISMKSLTDRLLNYIDYIDEISFNLNELGEGNLNIELKHKYDGEFAVIKDAFIKTTENFKTTISEIHQIAAQVANGSEQVASGSQMLAQGTTEQASSIEQLTATINEISNHVNQNAKNSLDASKYVKTVGDAANMSSDKMNQMMIAIEEINAKSSEIGKIVKTIDDIAFQTNILALNAAVEAARAGSAGKGFAVVADEVRNLATKSSEAAKNTTVLIEDSIRSIKNGTALAEDTSSVLTEVIEGVNQSVNLIEDISQASNLQASSLEETLDGLEQISAVVHTNSATAEESSAASEELSSQADVLQELTSRFNF
ncbi:MAG: methyl-accepting chemotaxis protein [Proteocatella sp.]